MAEWVQVSMFDRSVGAACGRVLRWEGHLVATCGRPAAYVSIDAPAVALCAEHAFVVMEVRADGRLGPLEASGAPDA
ncbi:MAG: hypothetical protein IT201_14515 [Thermoleophilia bacterium]|nr:hypothetical protein [Thermoleophilia bacterium]